MVFNGQNKAMRLQNNNSLVSMNQRNELFVQKKKKEKDRFGIFKITDINQLLDLSRNRRLDISLNDYISIFLRITQLTLDLNFNKFYSLHELFEKIQNELKKAEEDSPCIGRLSYCLSKSEYYENSQLWVELCDYILSDRFDSEYDEIYCAIQGFYKYQFHCKEDWQLKLANDVITKLESLSITHLRFKMYNLRTLKIIFSYIWKNNKFQENTLEEIENLLKSHLKTISENIGQHLLENQQQPYLFQPLILVSKQPLLLEELTDFAYFFSTNNYKSEILFYFLQNYIETALGVEHQFKEMEQQRQSKIMEQEDRIKKRKIQKLQEKSQEQQTPQKQEKEQAEKYKKFEQNQQNPINQQQKSENYKQSDENVNFNNQNDDNENKKQQFQSEEELDEILLNPLVWPLSLEGSGYSKLLYFFNNCYSLDPQLYLSDNVKFWLKTIIQDETLIFTMEDLKNIHQCLNLFDYQQNEQENLSKLLERRLFEINYHTSFQNENIKLSSLQDYLEIRVKDEYEGDFQKIQQRVYHFLDEMCHQKCFSFDAFHVQQFVFLIDDQKLIPNFKKFFSCLPEFVNKNLNFFTFDEQCYFCLICHQNQNYLNDHEYLRESIITFWSNLSLLEQQIKTASFSRGFKIDVHSNFYKLLQIVNIAEFFGEQQM